MNKLISLLLMSLVLVSCMNAAKVKTKDSLYIEVKSESYELHKPPLEASGVLTLFVGFAERIEDIKREFDILDKAQLL